MFPNSYLSGWQIWRNQINHSLSLLAIVSWTAMRPTRSPPGCLIIFDRNKWNTWICKRTQCRMIFCGCWWQRLGVQVRFSVQQVLRCRAVNLQRDVTLQEIHQQQTQVCCMASLDPVVPLHYLYSKTMVGGGLTRAKDVYEQDLFIWPAASEELESLSSNVKLYRKISSEVGSVKKLFRQGLFKTSEPTEFLKGLQK